MVRRPLWQEVGGFDPVLPVEGNDVDFCLRLGRAGEALATVEQLIASQPRELQPRLHRAACLEALGRNPEALQAYADFLAVVPLRARGFLAFARQHLEAV
jgi:GT2 family glycosyltransferase